MIAFIPTSTVFSFTGATTAPTSVQPLSTDGTNKMQFMLTNTDSTNDCVIGWGSTDAIAKVNAASPSAPTAAPNPTFCYYLLHSTQVVVTAPQGSYFTGITGSSTAIVKVQCGYGN